MVANGRTVTLCIIRLNKYSAISLDKSKGKTYCCVKNIANLSIKLILFASKETQKGKYKNPKVQKSKRREIVNTNNRIIQKSKVKT